MLHQKADGLCVTWCDRKKIILFRTNTSSLHFHTNVNSTTVQYLFKQLECSTSSSSNGSSTEVAQ